MPIQEFLQCEIQGLRPAKGDAGKDLLAVDAAAIRLVADVGGIAEHVQATASLSKPTRKTLNTLKHTVKFPAATNSTLHAFLATALRSSKKEEADIHFILLAMDTDQLRILDELGEKAPKHIGRELCRARASLRALVEMSSELKHSSLPMKAPGGQELGVLIVSTVGAVPLLEHFLEEKPDPAAVAAAAAEPAPAPVVAPAAAEPASAASKVTSAGKKKGKGIVPGAVASTDGANLSRTDPAQPSQSSEKPAATDGRVPDAKLKPLTKVKDLAPLKAPGAASGESYGHPCTSPSACLQRRCRTEKHVYFVYTLHL